MEAVKFFGDPDNALHYLSAIRWPDGVAVCPHCGGSGATFLKTRRIWKCKARECRKQFSIKVGTIFEDSPIGLDKWLCAVWMLANFKNGVSSYEIHRALGVTQKTAWFMLHRLRLSLQGKSGGKLSGEVEADEKAADLRRGHRKGWGNDGQRLGLVGEGRGRRLDPWLRPWALRVAFGTLAMFVYALLDRFVRDGHDLADKGVEGVEFGGGHSSLG